MMNATALGGLHHVHYSLREVSCVSTVRTDDNGVYSFDTTLPPSYGPPRHINYVLNIEGYLPITTRLYFAQDARLHQLTTTLEGIDDMSAADEPGFSRVGRVAQLHFTPTGQTNSSALGYFSGSFNLTLRPARDSRQAVNTSTVIAVNGIWFDDKGEKVSPC
jgi:hypothetical protein